MMALRSNRDDLARFISALFAYAEEGTFVSLRGFDQVARDVPPHLIRSVKINGDLSTVIERAATASDDCATSPRPTVFAPPICTFTNPDRARGVDLANGLVLSVELDEGNTMLAQRRLEGLLGQVTAVVASGGEWVNPETGEIHPKLHLHWRLSEPTRAPDEHELLRQARDMACRLVGADPTGKPVVHPLRWPGSWNRKATPVLSRLVVLNDRAEINLSEAVDALSAAIEAAGMDRAALPRSGEVQAPLPLIASAFDAIPNPGAAVHYDTWIKLGYAAYRASGGSPEGYDAWDTWSRKSDKYNAGEQESAWRRIRRAIEGSTAPRTIGAGTIFFHAAEAGWRRPQPEQEPPPAESSDPGWWTSLEQSLLEAPPAAEVETDAPETSAEPPQAEKKHGLDGKIIDPPNHWTAPAPLREWVVDGWIPRGYVTGIYGDGGVGKSLLAQQLLTAVASGLPWLGMDVRPGRAFGFMCEDDADELHRRQEAVNGAYGLQMRHLELLRMAARFGFDNILMTFDEHNRGRPTPIFTEMARFLETFRPTLVVIDTLADTFGGNEIVRAHARQFVQGIGGQLARQFNCAVVMAAHPSAAGIASGSGAGGSTAWSNTFRSRLYLTRPEGDGNDDKRLLSRMKANYAPKGGELTLQWLNGCFAPADRTQAGDGLSWPDINAIFREIERAWDAGDPWSNAPQTKREGRYLPLWAAIHLGCQERVVARYLNDWLAGGYLKVAILDPRTKARGLRAVRQIQPPVAAEVVRES